MYRKTACIMQHQYFYIQDCVTVFSCALCHSVLMKILASFTHPQVGANLNEFLSSTEHKEKIF